MLDHLVAIGNVVLHDHAVVALRIIVATVGVFFFRLRIVTILGGLSVSKLWCNLIWLGLLSLDFLHSLAEVIDLREVQDLCLFILGEVLRAKEFQGLGWGRGELDLLLLQESILLVFLKIGSRTICRLLVQIY